jgi:hypothetical protein
LNFREFQLQKIWRIYERKKQAVVLGGGESILSQKRKKGRLAESQAPLLQHNQSLPYLKDHLLLGTECRCPNYKTISLNFQQWPESLDLN